MGPAERRAVAAIGVALVVVLYVASGDATAQGMGGSQAASGNVQLSGPVTLMVPDGGVRVTLGSDVVPITGGVNATLVGTPSVSATIAGTVPVSGSVGISGTPTVSVSGTVPVSGSVGLTGTPAVTLAGTPSVTATINGTPTVSVSGTVPVSGTVTATLSGTPTVNATLTGTPTVAVSGTVPVSGAVNATIANTPTVNINGTVPVSGNVTATIASNGPVALTSASLSSIAASTAERTCTYGAPGPPDGTMTTTVITVPPSPTTALANRTAVSIISTDTSPGDVIWCRVNGTPSSTSAVPVRSLQTLKLTMSNGATVSCRCNSGTCSYTYLEEQCTAPSP